MSLIYDIAKDLCLAGVKSVTIYDPDPVQIHDLGSQVGYLTNETL